MRETNWLAIVVVLLITTTLGFFLADCSMGRNGYYEGYVAEHVYKPAYTSHYTTTDDAGNISHHTTYHPEEYHLICLAGALDFDIEVKRGQYAALTNNQNIAITTRVGRFTKANYMPRIAPRMKLEQ